MIVVTVKRNEKGNVKQFTVKGHAGYDDYGKDIVCAAVSALTLTTVHALQQVADVPLDYSITDGIIDCSIKSNITDKQIKDTQLLCESMLLGLRSTAHEYPKFLTIFDQGGER